MSVSLITSFVGTAANLFGAAKQRRLAEQASRQAQIDAQKAFKAIEKSKILDLELPMRQYEIQQENIERATRQAVEAAREAGPRGVAAIPRIQAAAVQGYQGLTAMKEKALIGLGNLAEQQRVRGELAEAELRQRAATGAQTAAAEARATADVMTTSALKSLTGAIGEETKFDPDEELYGEQGGGFLGFLNRGAQAKFKPGSQEALDKMTFDTNKRAEEAFPGIDATGILEEAAFKGMGLPSINLMNQFMATQRPKQKSVLTY